MSTYCGILIGVISISFVSIINLERTFFSVCTIFLFQLATAILMIVSRMVGILLSSQLVIVCVVPRVDVEVRIAVINLHEDVSGILTSGLRH